ncbi:MaoC dehydratase-like protein [Mumia flava]|uniref:MaoC dehydratase-like protein n=1 Tax=Mumia flava TaxID=1348852 RepID=A0A2M9B6T0_9ACTN|nr:MaoC/PaaZ C-terminal domain-containing protein [Mumia flava]PJJ53635.1 MaoC dehydratase-like protein [Mumia flava]
MATTTFDRPPATLPLYLRAALPALPVVGGLPGVKHASGSVPDLTLRRAGITTDLDHLAAYGDVCGFALRGTLPATYPHMAAFGLQMALMVDTAFPFAPMGLVHLRNTIVQHRPIGVGERYDVEVRAEDLRDHPKGRLIDLVTTATVGDEVVWDETMTLFRRGGRGGAESSPAPLTDVAAPVGAARWRLPADLGRRYGAVSGDRNPIHLSKLSAKAFGFPRQIAHGMWSQARALAAVENRLGDTFRVDAEFRKPILLPTTVSFGTREDGDGLLLGITGAPKDDRPGREHLVARVTHA